MKQVENLSYGRTTTEHSQGLYRVLQPKIQQLIQQEKIANFRCPSYAKNNYIRQLVAMKNVM